MLKPSDKIIFRGESKSSFPPLAVQLLRVGVSQRCCFAKRFNRRKDFIDLGLAKHSRTWGKWPKGIVNLKIISYYFKFQSTLTFTFYTETTPDHEQTYFPGCSHLNESIYHFR